MVLSHEIEGSNPFGATKHYNQKALYAKLTLPGLPAGFSRIYERESHFFAVLSEPNLVVGLCPENPHFGTFSLCLASFL